jgi:hypothetical protein
MPSQGPGSIRKVPGNLPLNTTILFQVCAKDSGGQGAWSQVLPTHLVEQLPAVVLRAVA